MTMSGFRANPQVGHLDRVKRIIGYCVRFKHATLCYRTQCPDYSNLPTQWYDWDMTPHGNVKEEIPSDCPEPLLLGYQVITTTCWVDANLYHDFMNTGLACTETYKQLITKPGKQILFPVISTLMWLTPVILLTYYLLFSPEAQT